MKSEILFKIIIILLVSLIFISCLDVETSINISNNLSGTWILKYKIMQEASYITPGTELKGYNFLPLSEAGIVERIVETPGLELVSLKSETNIIYTEYYAEIDFDNSNTIQNFFNPYVNTQFLNITQEEGTFEMLLYNPFPDSIDADTLNLFSSLYSDKNVNISIILPGIVTESNPGLLVENPSETNINLTIPELFNLTEPIKWIIKYE